MAISYSTARGLIETACQTVDPIPEEAVLLQDAVGRIASRDITSPVSSPPFDTSAMDGYAIRSAATIHASPEDPVTFRVKGTIAAGKGLQLFADVKVNGVEGSRVMEPCLEIMTGARFPTSGAYEELDACMRVEDVEVVQEDDSGLSKQSKVHEHGQGHRAQFANTSHTISIKRPVPPNSNRRPAGTDIQRGDVLLRAGQNISATQLMPLASVGIRSIAVWRRPRVGVWSTGAEILGQDAEKASPDVNGPFLMAALREAGCEAVFLGVLKDDVETISAALRDETAEGRGLDLLITTGGVSVGKFDCVRAALESLDAQIVFHSVDIRPGHPVLFSMIPGRTATLPARVMPFFGLPGNPGAAAACSRFLVIPFIHRLRGQGEEKPVMARLIVPEKKVNGSALHHGHLNGHSSSRSGCGRSQTADLFRPGLLEVGANGVSVVTDLGKGKGPSMLSPFTQANCWIHLPPTTDVEGEERIVVCYPTQVRSTWG